MLSEDFLKAARQRVAFVISQWTSLPVAVVTQSGSKNPSSVPLAEISAEFIEGGDKISARLEKYFCQKVQHKKIFSGEKEKPNRRSEFWNDFSHATDAKRKESLIG